MDILPDVGKYDGHACILADRQARRRGQLEVFDDIGKRGGARGGFLARGGPLEQFTQILRQLHGGFNTQPFDGVRDGAACDFSHGTSSGVTDFRFFPVEMMKRQHYFSIRHKIAQ
jgi:hypothetical protein